MIARLFFGLVVMFMWWSAAVPAYGQCNGQTIPDPGLFCTTAPILCQVECLDGFTGRLPDTLIQPQPASLCDGGEPNNLSWFAFVAGSDSISLTITPSNCTEILVVNDSTGVVNTYEGIQIGIHKTCDFEASDNELVCGIDCSTDPIDIGSSEFIIGEVYYLFVDGCAGSVCDYEVTVNFGEQAFEMPEITSFSNQYNIDFANDTICAGSSVDISIDDFDVTAVFEWTIDPPSTAYPSGIHPTTDTTTVTWEFSDPGNYEICVFAANFCDASDTTCFTVMVDTLVDEYFTPIEVCQECYPIVLSQSDTSCIIDQLGLLEPTVLTEDPNGDGLVGWQGNTPIMQAGTVVNVVSAEYGCTYDQYIEVSTIPIRPRESVLLYQCPDDFPLDYHGTTITGPVEAQFITIPNAASTGCDSLVSLTVQTVGQTARILTGDCIAGGLQLIFDMNSPIPEGAIVSYEWVYGGTVLTDSDGVDTALIVMDSGFYTVNITILVDGIDCGFSRGSSFVDLDDITPPQPEFGLIPDSVCVSGDPVALYVEQGSALSTYEWSLLPPLPFTFGITTDTIYVDVSGNNGFQYCVRATNNCGVSMDTCQSMTVSDMPTVSISASSLTSCIDSVVTVSYMGDANLTQSSFNWDFGGATVVNTTGLSGPGPHDITFSAEGIYNIGIAVQQGICMEESTVVSIEVGASNLDPVVECGSLSEAVSFEISNVPSDVAVSFTVVGGIYSDSTLTGNIITVSGIPVGTSVTIEVSYETACGVITELYDCMALDCPDVDLEIVTTYDEGQCLLDGGTTVSVESTLAGISTTAGSWEGLYQPEQGVIVITDVGEYPLQYILTDDGCEYIAADTIRIAATPGIITGAVTEDCGNDTYAVSISTDVSTVLTFGGEVVTVPILVGVEPGTYIIEATTAEGCSTESTLTLDEVTMPTITIVGELFVPETTEQDYTFTSTIADVEQVTWYLNDEVVCVGDSCTTMTLVPVDGDELCIEYIDEDGCEVSDCITLETFTTTTVYMPNVFAPNSNNGNGRLYPISNSSDLDILHFRVFDRWGNIVCNIENAVMGEQDYSWDGRYNGQIIAEGVYIYSLSYMDEQGATQYMTGDITVLR